MILRGALILGAHYVGIVAVEHSRLMEKIMATQFGYAEGLLMTTFVMVRLAAYFIAPALIVAAVFAMILRNESSEMSPG